MIRESFANLKDRWHPRNREKITGILQYVITDGADPDKFFVDFGESGSDEVVITEGEHESPNATITTTTESYLTMVRGEAKSSDLFKQKLIVVSGSNKMLALLYRANIAAVKKHTFVPAGLPPE